MFTNKRIAQFEFTLRQTNEGYGGQLQK